MSMQPTNTRPLPAAGLLDLQEQFRELGRLRMGAVEVRGGKRIPVKLATWRLTSPARSLIEDAADVYGGTVRKWEGAPTEGDQWEVITEAAELAIIVPPGHVLTQAYELWTGGGCKRRCLGPNPDPEGPKSLQLDRATACACPIDIAERQGLAQTGKACKPTTRLPVILKDVKGAGVWRLESHGYNAAKELVRTYNLLRAGAQVDRAFAAFLRIEHRTSGAGTDKKNYTVPVIDIEHRLVDVVQEIAEAAIEAGMVLPEAAPVQRAALAAGRPDVPADSAPAIRPGAAQEPAWPSAAPIPEAGNVIEGEVVEDDEPAELEPWIVELSGDDGTIIDIANNVLADRPGASRTVDSLLDLNGAPVDVRKEIAKRCKAAAQGTLS